MTIGHLAHAVVAVCVTLVALVNTIDINLGAAGAEEQIGIDAIVLSKLAISGLCGVVGLVGLFLLPAARSLLLGGPGLLLGMLGGVFVATSLFAIEEVANVSRIASILVVVYVGFASVALTTLGLRRIMIALLVGLVLNLIANWCIYEFVQSIGVFTEDLGGGIEVQRMGGLGHPNAIARLAVMSSLIVIGLGLSKSDDQSKNLRQAFLSPLAISIHLLAIATVYATYSRTAALAGVVACGLMVVGALWSRRGVAMVLVGTACVLMLGGVLSIWRGQDASLANQTFVGTVTKTGDLSELTSATGRTEIWTETIRLIIDRPVTGYGLNSAPVILDEEFSYHTHNALLHAAFSGGLAAGFLMLLLLVWNLLFGVTDVEPWIRGATVFLFISGLFEDTVLETFAGPSTLIWFVVLLVPAWRMLAQSSYDVGPARQSSAPAPDATVHP